MCPRPHQYNLISSFKVFLCWILDLLPNVIYLGPEPSSAVCTSKPNASAKMKDGCVKRERSSHPSAACLPLCPILASLSALLAGAVLRCAARRGQAVVTRWQAGHGGGGGAGTTGRPDAVARPPGSAPDSAAAAAAAIDRLKY